MTIRLASPFFLVLFIAMIAIFVVPCSSGKFAVAASRGLAESCPGGRIRRVSLDVR